MSVTCSSLYLATFCEGWHVRGLAGDEFFDVAWQVAVSRQTERAVVVDEHVGALLGDAKASPQLRCLVIDVLDGANALLIDKLTHRVWVAQAGYSEEDDFVTELLLCLYDRRGLCTSKWSPGGPEPQDDVLALKARKID